MIPPRLDFRRLKRRVSIELLLQANGYGAGMKKQGRRLVGPCPLHQGDNPRAFVADLSKNLWYCFTGCRAGGDVVDLARRLLGLSYPEVARYLASLTENAPRRRQRPS